MYIEHNRCIDIKKTGDIPPEGIFVAQFKPNKNAIGFRLK
jgi:hypothetical protein